MGNTLESQSTTCVTFLGILISCMSDVAFYYLRLDRYSISVGRFSSRVVFTGCQYWSPSDSVQFSAKCM